MVKSIADHYKEINPARKANTIDEGITGNEQLEDEIETSALAAAG